MLVLQVILALCLNVVAINASIKSDDSDFKPTEHRQLTTEEGSRLLWIANVNNTLKCDSTLNDFITLSNTTEILEFEDFIQTPSSCFISFSTPINMTTIDDIMANFEWISSYEADMSVSMNSFFYSEEFEDEDEQTPPGWGLQRISSGYSGYYDGIYFEPEYDGTGVKAFLLDTEVFANHRLYRGRVTNGPSFHSSGSAVEADYGGSYGPWTGYYGQIDGYKSDYDSDSNDNTPGNDERMQTHGTFVASLMIGHVVGIARNATLTAIQVLNERGKGSVSGVVNGVSYAIAEANGSPGVLVMPFSTASSSSLKSVVKDAYKAGLVVIAAAGNDAGDACNKSPANVEAVITVGASNKADEIPAFSNQKSCVDIFAPGAHVRGAVNSEYSSLMDRLSGTSMSTGYVAGAMISLMHKHNNDRLAAFNELMSTAETGSLTGLKSGSPDKLLKIQTVEKPMLCASPVKCFDFAIMVWSNLRDTSLYRPVMTLSDAVNNPELASQSFIIMQLGEYVPSTLTDPILLAYVDDFETETYNNIPSGTSSLNRRFLMISNETADDILDNYSDGIYIGGPPFRVPTKRPTLKPTMAPTVKNCDELSTQKSKCKDNNKCNWDATATPPCQLKPAYL